MSQPVAAEALVLDDHAMLALLMNAVQMYSGQRGFARRFEVSQRDVSLSINGQRPVSRAVAHALGFDRVVQPRRVVYRRRPR